MLKRRLQSILLLTYAIPLRYYSGWMGLSYTHRQHLRLSFCRTVFIPSQRIPFSTNLVSHPAQSLAWRISLALSGAFHPLHRRLWLSEICSLQLTQVFQIPFMQEAWMLLLHRRTTEICGLVMTETNIYLATRNVAPAFISSYFQCKLLKWIDNSCYTEP